MYCIETSEGMKLFVFGMMLPSACHYVALMEFGYIQGRRGAAIGWMLDCDQEVAGSITGRGTDA